MWAQDGVILGLAALMSGDQELVTGLRHMLLTLARHQGPHGEIPSNVDTKAGRVSYGGTTGRVDADLWFVIGCCQCWQTTGDDEFLGDMVPVMERVRFLLGAWEFNNRGLLYIPQTGDWADEYIHHGYVLYDQLLYLQALKELCAVHRHLNSSSDHVLEEKAARLKHMIRDNYWFDDGDGMPDDAYHEVLYRKGRKAASPHCAGHHWMSFFSRPYLAGILAHSHHPLHTNVLAGINDRIKVIKRMAYGFRDEAYFFLKIRAAFPGNLR